MGKRGAGRWVVRIFGAFFLLGLAFVVALALLLPALLSGEAAASRIRGAAFEATGSELEWGALDIALFPPALTLDGVRARAEELGTDPWLRAERIELRLAWLPLLARTVLIDSLSIEGAELDLRRDAEGWVVPGARRRGAEAASPEPTPTEKDTEAGGPAFSLAVRQLALHDGVLRLHDHSFGTPHRIELGEVQAQVEVKSLAAPIDVEVSGVFATGGQLAIDGTLSAERDLALELSFRDVAMEMLQPYLQEELALAGRASGGATLSGAAARLDRVDLKLRSEDAALMSKDLSASGPLVLELSLEDLERPAGRFSFDATRAVLVYQVMFRKPAGVEATAGGSFRTQDDGSLDVDFDKVRIRDLGARGEVRGGATPSFTLRTQAPVDLEGWDALVPALSGFSGRAALPELRVAWPVAGKAPTLQGRAQLDDLRVVLPEDPKRPLTLRGELIAKGSTVASRDLVAEFGGQQLPLDVRVEDLLSAPRWSVESALQNADANALASAWAQTPDTLFGTLFLDAKLGAPTGGERPLLDALSGEVALRIEPGRLRGVSLLRTAIDSIGPLAEAALLAGQIHGGSTLQRFFEDEFTALTGTFQVRDGRAHTRDLQLIYRLYQIDLHGDLGLADGGLDLDGTLTLFESDEGGETATRKVKRSFPLAGIRGTVDKPRVKIAPEVALAWVAGLRSARGDGTGGDATESQTRLEKKIDERLGKGSGREIFDALEGLLGSEKGRR